MEGYIITSRIKKPPRRNRGNSYPETRKLKDGRHYINIEAYREFNLIGIKVRISNRDFPIAEL